ncbi:MAG TPA: hypothetical protein VFR86_03610 [Burkholderiaceae bacterium]|nr:hypothetical protein [Burkholderiaceae bacterium]
MLLLRTLLILVMTAAIGLSSVAVAADMHAETPCAQAMGDQDRGCEGTMGGECVMSASGCTPPAITATPTLLAVPPARLDLTVWDATRFSSLALAPDCAPPKHPLL